MKFVLFLNIYAKKMLQILLAGVFITVFSLPVFAQSQQRGAVNNQMARVEEINENKDLIVIGSNNIIFDREKIKVFYKGEQVDKFMLIPGLRVRYSVDSEGYLSEVNLLSPRNILDMMMTQ